MEQRARVIAENLARVQDRMSRAARRAGRDPATVTLVAVTKYVDSADARLVSEAGCGDLGESRPQTLWRKNEELADLPIRWHLIGHLQRNKVGRTIEAAALIHSIDRLELLEEIERRAPVAPVEALIEINVSGDASKHGLAPAAAESFLLEASRFRSTRIRGLMTMAAREGDLQVARDNFSALRELRDRLTRNCPPPARLDELSMGMSGDFEVAIEEGATIVRVGSAIFEGLSE